MKKLHLIVFITLFPLVSIAQTVPVDAPTPPPKPNVESELQKVLHVDKSASFEDLLSAGKKTYSQARQAHKSQSATEIALALSSLLFLALAGLRRVLGAERLSGNKIRLSCLIAGSLACLLGYYGGGYGAIESIQLFMAGIGSMAINETIKIAKPKKA